MGMGLGMAAGAAGGGMSDIADRLQRIIAANRHKEQLEWQNDMQTQNAIDSQRHGRVMEDQGQRGLDFQGQRIAAQEEQNEFNRGLALNEDERAATRFDERNNLTPGQSMQMDQIAYNRERDELGSAAYAPAPDPNTPASELPRPLPPTQFIRGDAARGIHNRGRMQYDKDMRDSRGILGGLLEDESGLGGSGMSANVFEVDGKTMTMEELDREIAREEMMRSRVHSSPRDRR